MTHVSTITLPEDHSIVTIHNYGALGYTAHWQENVRRVPVVGIGKHASLALEDLAKRGLPVKVQKTIAHMAHEALCAA